MQLAGDDLGRLLERFRDTPRGALVDDLDASVDLASGRSTTRSAPSTPSAVLQSRRAGPRSPPPAHRRRPSRWRRPGDRISRPRNSAGSGMRLLSSVERRFLHESSSPAWVRESSATPTRIRRASRHAMTTGRSPSSRSESAPIVVWKWSASGRRFRSRIQRRFGGNEDARRPPDARAQGARRAIERLTAYLLDPGRHVVVRAAGDELQRTVRLREHHEHHRHEVAQLADERRRRLARRPLDVLDHDERVHLSCHSPPYLARRRVRPRQTGRASPSASDRQEGASPGTPRSAR